MVYTDYRLRADALNSLSEYKRHAYTETGVSPLAVPGESRHVVVTDSDEHGEDGHLTEDAETRKRMVKKRLMKKLPLIQKEIAPPVIYGAADSEILLVGWGSTYGVIKEAVDELSPPHPLLKAPTVGLGKGGRRGGIAMLHFSEIFPFPGIDVFDYLAVLRNAKKSICIEQNATGQLRMLLFLTKLGVHDERMQEALECLRKKQNKLGQWKQQHEFPKNKKPRMSPVPITAKGQPSKWVTLKALMVLKRYGEG